MRKVSLAWLAFGIMALVLSLFVASSSPALADDLNSLQLSASSGYNGQTFTLTESGFSPKEAISLWETTPRYTVNALPGVVSDSNGNFTYTYLSHTYLEGRWAITAHGLTSNVEKVGYLQLIVYVAGGPATVTLSRTHVSLNTSIDIHATNFVQNEEVSSWVTAPDGQVYPVVETTSDEKATMNNEVHLRYVVPVAKPGQWAVTVYGLYSTRTAVAYFFYDNQ